MKILLSVIWSKLTTLFTLQTKAIDFGNLQWNSTNWLPWYRFLLLKVFFRVTGWRTQKKYFRVSGGVLSVSIKSWSSEMKPEWDIVVDGKFSWMFDKETITNQFYSNASRLRDLACDLLAGQTVTATDGWVLFCWRYHHSGLSKQRISI